MAGKSQAGRSMLHYSTRSALSWQPSSAPPAPPSPARGLHFTEPVRPTALGTHTLAFSPVSAPLRPARPLTCRTALHCTALHCTSRGAVQRHREQRHREQRPCKPPRHIQDPRGPPSHAPPLPERPQGIIHKPVGFSTPASGTPSRPALPTRQSLRQAALPSSRVGGVVNAIPNLTCPAPPHLAPHSGLPEGA